ncbi:hypothetical protein D9M68_747180 [compost metagenome]
MLEHDFIRKPVPTFRNHALKLSRLWRYVKAKPLFRKLLDRAVSLGSFNGFVEHFLKFRFILADTNGNTTAKDAALEVRTGHDDVFIAWLLGCIRQISQRSNDQIDAARLEVKIMLIGGLVFADIG